mmetsp:Transcript_4626/g.13094  ORF Transcript_4626/g.13094 Transcript_4626/m.13094 type:complete len:263 (+) Transcript_4626:1415-2203(+)
MLLIANVDQMLDSLLVGKLRILVRRRNIRLQFRQGLVQSQKVAHIVGEVLRRRMIVYDLPLFHNEDLVGHRVNAHVMLQQGLLRLGLHRCFSQSRKRPVEIGSNRTHIHLPRRARRHTFGFVRISRLAFPNQLGRRTCYHVRIVMILPKVEKGFEPLDRMTERNDELGLRKVFGIPTQRPFNLHLGRILHPVQPLGALRHIGLVRLVHHLDHLGRSVGLAHEVHLALIDPKLSAGPPVPPQVVHHPRRAAFGKSCNGKVQHP